MFQTKDELIAMLDEYLQERNISQDSIDRDLVVRYTLKKLIERDFSEFLERYKAVLDLILKE